MMLRLLTSDYCAWYALTPLSVEVVCSTLYKSCTSADDVQFVADQLTVGGQIDWSRAGQWQVDEGGHPASNRKPVQLLKHWRDTRNVERPPPNVQRHSGQTSALARQIFGDVMNTTVSCSSPGVGDTKWTPRRHYDGPRLTYVRRAVGAAVRSW